MSSISRVYGRPLGGLQTGSPASRDVIAHNGRCPFRTARSKQLRWRWVHDMTRIKGILKDPKGLTSFWRCFESRAGHSWHPWHTRHARHARHGHPGHTGHASKGVATCAQGPVRHPFSQAERAAGVHASVQLASAPKQACGPTARRPRASSCRAPNRACAGRSWAGTSSEVDDFI